MLIKLFCYIFNRDEEDLHTLLEKHQVRCVSREDAQEIIIRRAKLLPTAFNAVQSRFFDCCREITVKFSGEDGADAGGPRCEFFRYSLTAHVHASQHDCLEISVW